MIELVTAGSTVHGHGVTIPSGLLTCATTARFQHFMVLFLLQVLYRLAIFGICVAFVSTAETSFHNLAELAGKK